VPIMCSSLVVPIMCSSLVADQSVVIVCLILHSSFIALACFLSWFVQVSFVYNPNIGYGPVTLLYSLRCLEYLLFGHSRSANLWWFVVVDSRVYRRCSSLCRSWEDCWFFALLVII
jgi:hypothetical protein